MVALRDVTEVVHGTDAVGKPAFSVLVKRTFGFASGETARPLAVARPFNQADEYFGEGDPLKNSIRREGELVSFKKRTDVVLVASAYAVSGTKVREMVATFSLNGMSQSVLVRGDRVARYRGPLTPSYSDPVPFDRMPIRYERAYGGKDDLPDQPMPMMYPRNPVGRGFVFARDGADGIALPNIERPGDELTPDRLLVGKPEKWNLQPLPAGFGWSHKAWFPRCSFAGAIPQFTPDDELLREEKMGILPPGSVLMTKQFRRPSFDPELQSGASEGMSFPYLKGDEEISLVGMSPDGRIDFGLPAVSPKMGLDVGMGPISLPTQLQTVQIRVDEREVDMIWQAVFTHPGVSWLSTITKLDPVVVWSDES